MNVKKSLEKYYKETPLNKIPWYYNKADYFAKLLNSNELGNGKALDLGCGVGTKSIALAKHSFKITGVDVSPTAILYARQNAENEKVKVRFIVADAADLLFLGNEKFDLILDWACLHGIPKTKRKVYVDRIIRHTQRGSKLLLRCFGKHDVQTELGFLSPVGLVYLFSKADIEKLFGKYFKILKTNRSKPRNHPGKWFDEYLMERL